MNTFELSIVIVLMGAGIVFAMLFLLNIVTAYYGKAINFIKLNKNKFLDMPKSNKKDVFVKNEEISNSCEMATDELIAVISAAVYTVGENKMSKYKIKSITPSKSNNSASEWGLMGLIENTNSIYFN